MIHHIDGLAPDKRFEVVLRIGTVAQLSRITYDLIDLRDHRLIASVSSSYQPDLYEIPGFSLQHALDTTVTWNSDSRFVALEEANHRHIGEVFLLTTLRTRSRNLLPIPKKEIVARIGKSWDKERLFSPIWTGRRTLTVEIAGKTFDAVGKTSSSAAYRVFLKIEANFRIRVVSIKEDPNWPFQGVQRNLSSGARRNGQRLGVGVWPNRPRFTGTRRAPS